MKYIGVEPKGTPPNLGSACEADPLI